jgi:hypothetical protein
MNSAFAGIVRPTLMSELLPRCGRGCPSEATA